MIVDKLANFALEKFKNYEYDWIKKQIIQGIVNNTVDYIIENQEVIDYVRYNIINSGRVADVLELRVTSSNGKQIIKHFIQNGYKRFPTLKFIRFERDIKYPNRGHKLVEIEKFL